LSNTGLPDLRLLPDAPVPDGRTVLTNPDATGIEAVKGHRAHLAPFIPDTNDLERPLARQPSVCQLSDSDPPNRTVRQRIGRAVRSAGSGLGH
jgi:hypothetical protein